MSWLIPSFDWVYGMAGGIFTGWIVWGRPYKKFRADVLEKATEIQNILESAERENESEVIQGMRGWIEDKQMGRNP